MNDQDKYEADRIDFLSSVNRRRLKSSDPVFESVYVNHRMSSKRSTFDVYRHMSVEPFHLLLLNLSKGIIEYMFKTLSGIEKSKLNKKFMEIGNDFQKIVSIYDFGSWKVNDMSSFLLFGRFAFAEC